MKKDKPNYYAIITAEVRYNNNLTDSEKLLYGEITALSNQKGYCWSSNKYFADLYDVTKGTISKRISKLVDEGYLKRELIRNNNNEVVERKLYPLNSIGYAINKQEGMVNKNQVNTTRTNTTSNNNSCSDSKSQNDKVKFDKNSKPYQLAMYLKNKINNNIPNQPTPKDSPKAMEEWSLAMDRLHRLGTVGGNNGYSWKKIREIIDWCQQDEFWYKNILSATKLRKQAVKLETRMKEDQGYLPKQMEEKIDYYADLN